ncbi:hypothetical protein SDC9_208545 [bioreactor metagenome]|uniref:Uncharacterized protein n=1 Tax=bioreactor metagenome TaxID=1076179 RepID=A0A645JMG7_9ZZZZ
MAGVGLAALAAHSINLVNKQNRGRVSSRFFKQFTHSLRAASLIFGDKRACHGGDERHVAFTRHSLGKHGFACTWRTI